MGPALAVAVAVKGLGVVAAAGAAGGALLLQQPRARAIAALIALALTPVLLVGELWNSPQMVSLRSHGGLAVALVVAGLLAIAALAWLLRRHPWLLPPLAVATLPFRIPLESGGESANLLVPLYVVVAAGVVAYAWNRLVGRRDAEAAVPGNGAGDPGPWRDPVPGRIDKALVAFVLLYAFQSLYSADFETALKNVAFFYVPFMLLFRLLTSVHWTRRVVVTSAAVLLGLALAFAGIGFAEYATRHIFWNQKVIASNEFESYFRVNSLFFDPNIYGRFLAMVMIGLATSLLWPRSTRAVAFVSIVLAVLWAAIILTFSQSSFAALLAGLGVLAALRWSWKPVLWAGAAVAAIGIGIVLLAPGAVNLKARSLHAFDRASSGRLDLMRGGLAMFADRPFGGYGSGAFAKEFRAREKVGSRSAASASHTIPITVAAEQGVVGLAAYVFLLVSAFALVFRGLGELRQRVPPLRLVSRAYVAAAFTGLVLHTLLYAAFLEDPITWALLAAAVVLSRPGPSASPASSASARAQSPSSAS